MSERLVRFYLDVYFDSLSVDVDDFIVTVGKKGHTNSVYHVAESRFSDRVINGHKVIRYNVKCYKSDLMTCCGRNKQNQKVILMTWYPRNKGIKVPQK